MPHAPTSEEKRARTFYTRVVREQASRSSGSLRIGVMVQSGVLVCAEDVAAEVHACLGGLTSHRFQASPNTRNEPPRYPPAIFVPGRSIFDRQTPLVSDASMHQ